MNLFINTALNYIQLMTFEDDKILQTSFKESSRQHTTLLYKMIDELNIDFNKIKNIYLVTGPGSYTGLRVGVIFAKTLAKEMSIKIRPIILTDLINFNNSGAIDLKGNKFHVLKDCEYIIVTKVELNEEVIDPVISFKDIFKFVNSQDIKAYESTEIQIFYAKDAV